MMTKQEALNLEAKLSSDANIRRLGTIKITDVKSGKTEIHATYAAADILRLLNSGYSIRAVISILDKEDKQFSHGD